MRNKIYVIADEILVPLQSLYPKKRVGYEWLIRAMNAYCGYTGSTGVLLMPPQALRPTLPETEVRGTVTLVRPENEEAGQRFICAHANRDVADGTRTEVVTDYQRIVRPLERSQCRLIPTEKFAARLEGTLTVNKEKITREPRQKFEGLSDAEVGYWLRMFSDGSRDD